MRLSTTPNASQASSICLSHFTVIFLFQHDIPILLRSRKGGKEPRAPKLRTQREPGQASRVRYNGGWHPAMGWASLAAEEKARAEAVNAVQEIEDRGGVADVKVGVGSG